MSLQTEFPKIKTNLAFSDIESLLSEQTFSNPYQVSYSDKVQEVFLEGQQHGANGNWQEAIKSFRKLVKLAPSAESDFFLGTAYYAAGNFKKAIEYIEEAVRRSPNTYRFQSVLGALLIQQGKLEKALKPIQKAITLNRNRFTAYIHLGFIQSERHKWKQAIEAYESALRLNKNFAPGYLALASAYIEFGFSKGAEKEEFLRKAVETIKIYQKFDPSHTDAQNALGQLYYWLGQVEDAEKAFTKTLTIEPNNVEALNRLRLVKEKQLEQKLFESGLLKKINEPITDFTPYQNRDPIKIKGKPLSETIIEERG